MYNSDLRFEEVNLSFSHIWGKASEKLNNKSGIISAGM
jgi:hypothetical protein